MLTLLLGGARSGKSRLAQRLAEPFGRVCYVATAPPAGDPEMIDRIGRHRSARPAPWQTIEEPLDLAGVVEKTASSSDAILVDCLTLWLSNLLDGNPPDRVEEIARQQISRIAAAARCCRVILVSNEVGCGIVPETPLGRIFRDVQGRANQAAAEAADEVALVVAGLPLYLKGGPR